MDCAICYTEIKDHKLFKVGCCSVNLCVDCVKEGKLKKCPQCQESYNWINSDSDDIKTLTNELHFISILFDDCINMNQTLKDQIKDLESKIEDLKHELKIKSKYMDQMSNTIIQLIEEKEEEEENERELESVVLRYHLNLI